MPFIATDWREHMDRLGFRTFNEMIGRVDKIEPQRAIKHWKAAGLDFSAILYQPPAGPEIGRYCQIPQDHGLENALDNQTLLDLAEPALEKGRPGKPTLPIRTTHRRVGTIL